MLLNISTALYLLATGIMGFSDRLFKGGEIRAAVREVFGRGDLSGVIAIVLSICAIAAGAFILLRLFGVSIPITALLLVILMIVWVIFILLIDLIPLFKGSRDFVDFLRIIASHLMVLGGMALATERFGG
jgi:fatty acid desaturase